MEKPTESKRAADIVFYDESLLLRQEKSFERESREYSVFESFEDNAARE